MAGGQSSHIQPSVHIGTIFFLAKNREAISAESPVLAIEGRLQVIENWWRALRACGLSVCPTSVAGPYREESLSSCLSSMETTPSRGGAGEGRHRVGRQVDWALVWLIGNSHTPLHEAHGQGLRKTGLGRILTPLFLATWPWRSYCFSVNDRASR